MVKDAWEGVKIIDRRDIPNKEEIPSDFSAFSPMHIDNSFKEESIKGTEIRRGYASVDCNIT